MTNSTRLSLKPEDIKSLEEKKEHCEPILASDGVGNKKIECRLSLLKMEKLELLYITDGGQIVRQYTFLELGRYIQSDVRIENLW
jgi:hypothetical protein